MTFDVGDKVVYPHHGAALIEAIETRKPHHADGWAGYESVRILEAALQSAKEGRTIKLT